MKTFQELIGEVRASIQEMSADDLNAEQEEGKVSVILDVRESEELEEGILPGAMHIPRGLLELSIEKAVPERAQPIVVYCAGGVRSALAAKSLLDLGYENVRSLIGGFTIWEASGFPIDSGE